MPLSDEVQNFTETLVEEMFDDLGITDEYDNDYVQDLFCLVLNRVPQQYLRHSIDVRINMTDKEREQANDRIREAIEDGQALLANDRRQEQRLD